MSGFTRSGALRGSTSVYTRSLRHANAVLPRFWGKRVAWQDPRLKDVKPKDRIKWWNIVPGDQVRLRGDTENVLREVQSVNKLTNTVYLRRATESDNPETSTRGQGVHYSKCQLFVGKHQFPPEAGSSEPKVLPVFATRVDISAPRWQNNRGYFLWKRFAANTTPRLPGQSAAADEHIIIPWPKPPSRPKAEPTAYDTPLQAVKAITYVKPRLPSNPEAIPDLLTEQLYINALRQRKNVNPAAPLEVRIGRELSNPHSRAKKQARWKAAQEHRRQLLEEFMQAEIKKLNGRTRKEARQEAVWKWKNKLVEERKAELKRKADVRGQLAKLERKRVMKARKAARLERKLSGLELKAAANQVIPTATATA
ncbi:hypothetical protein BDW22DRAFT_1367342 [Trametopsis cervina]|nr:hypothetical protein BDW22DRAFT_1367342 [Trametopsis cervina]